MSLDVIWKMPLVIGGNIYELPVGAKVVHIQTQENHWITGAYRQPCIWFRCSPTAPKERRKFTVVGTGESFDASATYHGSFILDKEGLVFHVLEIPQ